jgi:hypothetical protein
MAHFGALLLLFPRTLARFLTHPRLLPIRSRWPNFRHQLPVPRNPNALPLHGSLHQLLKPSFRFSQSNGQHDCLHVQFQYHVGLDGYLQ